MKKRLEQPPTRFQSLLEGHIGQYRWLEALLSKTETDISLAELESLNRKLSDLLVEKQLASALQLAEHLQVRLAREKHTLSDPEWDLARAVFSVNRGVTNFILGNLELANSSFCTASTLYSDARRLGRSSRHDQDRAILARNHGECLERMGDTANALEKYDEAAHFFFQEHLRTQDSPNRNTLLMLLEGRGRCSEKMGQFQKAASSYSDALSIHESHFSSKNTESRAARIRLAIVTCAPRNPSP